MDFLDRFFTFLLAPWFFIVLAVIYSVRTLGKSDAAKFASEMATLFCLAIAAILWHMRGWS